MANLDELETGQRLEGVIPGKRVTAIAVTPHGPDAVELTYRTPEGDLGQRVLTRDAEINLAIVPAEARPLDADAADFKLVAECQRIKLAGLSDPMLAVTTSDIQALPHQLRAVYGELLPRTPLRFLLADDPGAGKTIMAGLYIKELILREDVKRCLVVVPGGLVEQWQDELYLKFGLAFEIFERRLGETVFGASAFEQHPFLIARMDQLARNEDLLAELGRTEWDLVVVDEAHRMGAHYFGAELRKTKRFQLGELLGRIARHLLLMTATPHSGKEEDFQLFLTLLDRDRFEGKYDSNRHDADTSGVMRRMVKEDLLTFDGKPLFPERIAETVPYELTELEQDLYEQVTSYVREGMNRAARLDDKRRNTVGFALTILQRRLASSPEAIYRSLERRVERLERQKRLLLSGAEASDPEGGEAVGEFDEFDDEEFSAEELENLEDEFVDAATAARTVEELDAELAELRDLVSSAAGVRLAETDRKWSELRTILEDNTLSKSGAGDERRKLIVFTEHRDTLEYLKQRIGSLLGRPDAVRVIHGGIRRNDRRTITEEFTHNPDCQILIATDAAGEGLNLQAAHLMVNYDLPWNPNRIEQRFGRIHRIGQREVCRLWNLVAEGTREGEVFVRLLAKIEEQRKAYGGKVFDVLGSAFGETPLRKLLIEAIQYGELPETRAKMELVIDASVAKGIEELLAERALATDSIQDADIAELRRQMDEARARRLQPHYIEGAFRAAFSRLGGKVRKREAGRFEITHVPTQLRDAARGPVATRYDRVTFDRQHLLDESSARAQLLAPGHPLHDAVVDLAISHFQRTLEQGTVLVSPTVTEPHLLVGVVQEVVDGTEASVARRFGYAFIGEDGAVEEAGPAPYLDCVPAPATDRTDAMRVLPWLVGAEDRAESWIIAYRVPAFLEEVRTRREAELERVRDQVDQRLVRESERLQLEAMVAREKEQIGQKPRESHSSLMQKAADLDARRDARLTLLAQQLEMQSRPPRVATAALVLPLSAVEEDVPEKAPIHALETKAVERRGIDLVLAQETELGRYPVEQAFNNPGFDVLSHRDGDDPIRIEVKARISGADDFFVTHNEVLTALNSAPRYRLALVSVDPRGPDHDEVRYLENPFAGFDTGDFDATGHRGKWEAAWDRGRGPF
ncbi:MAG TPA: helicase-related protein [Solirubrobacterales bacterium]|nr:helicase-related protein [Solirubrobacterales bacterium]